MIHPDDLRQLLTTYDPEPNPFWSNPFNLTNVGGGIGQSLPFNLTAPKPVPAPQPFRRKSMDEILEGKGTPRGGAASLTPILEPGSVAAMNAEADAAVAANANPSGFTPRWGAPARPPLSLPTNPLRSQLFSTPEDWSFQANPPQQLFGSRTPSERAMDRLNAATPGLWNAPTPVRPTGNGIDAKLGAPYAGGLPANQKAQRPIVHGQFYLGPEPYSFQPPALPEEHTVPLPPLTLEQKLGAVTDLYETDRPDHGFPEGGANGLYGAAADLYAAGAVGADIWGFPRKRDELLRAARMQQAAADQYDAPSPRNDLLGAAGWEAGNLATGWGLPILAGGGVGLVARATLRLIARKALNDAAKRATSTASAVTDYGLNTGELYRDMTADGVDPMDSHKAALLGVAREAAKKGAMEMLKR